MLEYHIHKMNGQTTRFHFATFNNSNSDNSYNYLFALLYIVLYRKNPIPNSNYKYAHRSLNAISNSCLNNFKIRAVD